MAEVPRSGKGDVAGRVGVATDAVDAAGLAGGVSGFECVSGLLVDDAADDGDGFFLVNISHSPLSDEGGI
ncbi:MAG: hypothetical protein JJ879_05055 [Sneathiella sp.]|nr:hypothetical protein [Sneathiella sp.]